MLLVGMLMACGESNTNTGSASSSSSNSSSAPTTAPAQHFKVGQQVKVGSTWDITVDSAKTSQGGQFSALQKPGDVYLLFTISMKNVSSQGQDVSSALQFTLQDASGQKYNETIDPNASATLDGKVEAGSPLKGVIAYEVPSTVKSYILSFQNSITDTGQTQWDVTV